MKKMGRDTTKPKRLGQEKTEPISYTSSDVSLEDRVAACLLSVKGNGSIGDLSLKLGIPKMSLSRYIRKNQSMTLATLQKIAAALDTDPLSLLK